ncbi:MULTISPECIES: fasciclin domain-containing protein [Micromonospora]|uniref:Uncaracterized surface protein containing fasciclin (FAS1) repeats n=1 Tax=Micromonospora yangpuensis TaxID=683228 RepID=A0A1C6UST1_9ACTN|nr:fasciclin domain-containing protein [Micromonospora yangpuensis]GGM29054.1 hypothetical protein GCM10012279_54710 [Micromonospora yangpuensis]SCL57147.1 Uncaracterized surface protein containing fasciclin (FAS1) repeats [Micromonospora yangpuensis]
MSDTVTARLRPTSPLGWPATGSGIVRRRRVLTGATLAMLIALTGCTGSTGPEPAQGPAQTVPVAVAGPLCDALPSGTEPGNPNSLAGQTPDQALTWIPVLTTFEAAVRATGLAAELAPAGGVTILAPTDDAFRAKFSTDNVDELLLKKTDTLRDLLREHVVTGAHSAAELATAGTVTTLTGSTLTVTAAGAGARVADRAETVCADYRAAGARIHVVDAVLGNLPDTAHEEEHHH